MKILEVQNNDIQPSFFLIEANRYIYMSIEYLFSKNQTPTPFAIMEVLKNRHAKATVEEFGGIEYLTILSESHAEEGTLGIFCEKLKQAYTRYKLYLICNKTKEDMLADKMEVLNSDEILKIHEEELNALTMDVQQTSEIYKMGASARERLEIRADSPNAIPGLEVGWPKFDYYTNGGQPGDLIMLCARSKTGKSAMLTNWATNIGIKDNVPVLYIDTEMNEVEQEDRILSILSGVPHKEIISGMYVVDTEFGKANEKREKIGTALELLDAGEYYHVYIPDFTVEKIKATTQIMKRQKDIQAMFFDYLKFPSNSIAQLKLAAEWQILGYTASSLKDLAGRLKIPIYAGCQENRSDPTSDKKDERNVGGSDKILHYANKLIFLNNKSDEQIMKEGNMNGNQNLYIAYQRGGESNCPPINIQFDRYMLRQYEI